MVNKCAIFGCKRGNESEELQHEEYHAFYFPLNERKSHLLPAWEKFVCRDGWKPSANSVICGFHFEDRLIRKGKRRTLKWKLNSMPTMLTDEMKAMPQSVQPTPAAPPRKPPAKRTYQEDEINAFLTQDIIGDFSELNSTHAPPGFLEALADWLEKWHDDCPAFTLTSKTSYALVLTLRAQSGLIKELLSEGYDFVMTIRLQSDPIERRFSQYRQMSGGRFLVSLREVTNSERIIRCRSLVKADINFWNEDLGSGKPSLDFSALLALLSEHKIEITESTLDSSSEEVSTTIAGNIAKKLAKRSNYNSCKSLLIASSMDLAENHYLNLLSRGGLIVPSAKLAEYTSHCFAIMDYSYNIVQAYGVRDVRAAYTQIFDWFSPQIDICCSKHNNWGLKFAAKIVINTFFNNKQTVSSDSTRKDTVVAFKKRQRTK